MSTAEKISRINPDFIGKGASGVSAEDLEDITRKADRVEEIVRGNGPLKRFINDVKLLIAMIRDYG